MIRLDRYLVTLGCGSRSEVQKAIRAGKATVDGTIIRDPAHACREGAAIHFHGEALDTRLMRHVMLNKPAGLLTAARDKKQPTVMDLLPPAYASIGCMPVGRLDKDTTGLLLLTCDGELNHRLLAPARHVDKTYLAEVNGPLSTADVDAFAQGLHLSDFQAQGAVLEILYTSPTQSTARVTIHEGKFHQIKRMFEAVGREVTQLHRERFGPLTLDSALSPGQWRELTPEEQRLLYEAAQMEAHP